MSAVEANRRKGRLVTVLPVAIFALIGAGFFAVITGFVARRLFCQGGDATMLPAVRKHTGCGTLPDNNRIVTVGDRQIAWLGPDEFLLLCEAGSEADLHSQLSLDLGGVHAAVTNVTDSLCALDLRGAAIRKVLAKGCSLDLHPSKFTAGDCAQTMLAHAGVTLIAQDENRFTLICRTSFAPYVADWLMDAGMEYGATLKV